MLVLLLFAVLSSVFSHGNKLGFSQDILSSLLAQSNLTIYEECSSFSGDCFVVKDYVYFYNGQVHARRHLKPKMNMLGSITIAQLLVPSPLTKSNLFIRNWKIDKKTIVPSFPTGELYIAVGYITEALSYESREKQQVLMVGLGGGVISNYLSTLNNIELTAIELDPTVVRIAERYFGHQDVTGVTRTHIADGASFLTEAESRGLKYKVIMIDADYNGDTTGTGLIGPVKEFVERATIQNIFECLEDKGTVAVNVVSVHSREQRERETLQAYQHFFPSCYYLPLLTVRNKLLICSKRANWTLENQRDLFKKNLRTSIQRLGFRELEYELNFQQ